MSSPWVIRTRGDAINTTLFTAFSDEKWTIASIAGILCVRKDDFESLGSRTAPAARLEPFSTQQQQIPEEQTGKIVLWFSGSQLMSLCRICYHGHTTMDTLGGPATLEKEVALNTAALTQSPLKRWDHVDDPM